MTSMTAMSGSPSPLRSATDTETGMLVSAIVPLVVRIGSASLSPASAPVESAPYQRFSFRKPCSNPPFPIMFLGAEGAGAGAWASNAAEKTKQPAWARTGNREIRIRRTVIIWTVREMKSIQTRMKICAATSAAGNPPPHDPSRDRPPASSSPTVCRPRPFPCPTRARL